MTMELNKQTVLETVEAKNGKRGFTLTEIAIVLGIIGLILGSIWVAAAAVYTNLRSSKTTTELLTIVQNIRAMYATSATVDSAADITTFGMQASGAAQTYINAGIFPNDMVSVSGTTKGVQNPWNGYAAVAAATTVVASDSFAVSFDAVPQNACITLATSQTGTGRDPGMVGLTFAAAGTAPSSNAAAGYTTLPVTASAAQTNCKSPTGALSFVFKLK